ncbi:uncharacterized protein FTOL_02914 [Fusarium torulosum]|uniref:Uncharacterized protein n=1 Tax=Fusarium torulosum TaxID=33205 RepID=A0AAE8SF83_9HYPO|nr:uncharacterized protein FTOL_02914 [Fusarium torulosum]
MEFAGPIWALLSQWRAHVIPGIPGIRAPPAPPHWNPIRKAIHYTFNKRCWTIFFELAGYIGAMKFFIRVAHGRLFEIPIHSFAELVASLISLVVISAWITAYEP